MQNQDGIVTPENVTTIRHVDANRAVDWVTGGFNLFMKKPGELVIAGLILFVVGIVLAFVPMIGGALSTMIGVVAAGAFILACQAIEAGQQPLPAAQKAASFSPLYMLGLIAAAFGIAVTVMNWVMITMVLGAAFISPFAAVGLAGIGWIISMLLSIPVLMALWLAPGLVLLKGSEPIEAVRLSFAASLKNIVPFLIFYVLAAVATFLGTLLMGLGLIVVYPALLCAGYLAYKDIFGTVAIGEAVGYIGDAQ